MKRFVVSVSAGLLATAAVLLAPSPASAQASRTMWLQTIDSCRHALPAAYQTVHVPGGHPFVIGPGAGTKPVNVSAGPCPLPHGSCTVTSTGCMSFSVPIPASGSVTYTISQSASQAAPNTVPCTGGSACLSERAFFVIYPTGLVQARTVNVYPDGTRTWFPSQTGYAAATQDDPILFHDFVLGSGSCDGDDDADDHLTGSPSSHCDNDRD